MDQLIEAREKINAVDQEMARLFEERMQAVKVIAEYKKAHGLPVYDAQREQAVIERGRGFVQDPEISACYTRFLKDVMDISKQYQERLIGDPSNQYNEDNF